MRNLRKDLKSLPYFKRNFQTLTPKICKTQENIEPSIVGAKMGKGTLAITRTTNQF